MPPSHSTSLTLLVHILDRKNFHLYATLLYIHINILEYYNYEMENLSALKKERYNKTDLLYLVKVAI